MTDDEFWQHVYADGDGPEAEETGEPPELTTDLPVTPCEVCGTAEGSCGYDEEGRPWIHATAENQ